MAGKRVTVIFTGGTIAMGIDPQTGGAVPLLSGEDLMRGIPDLREIAAVEVRNFCNKPGPHIRPEEVLELAGVIAGIFDRDEADGVVVTHGTDTIEETAYELDLLLAGDRPVVVTGAMRTSAMISADGPANIMNAVLTAADEAARAKGVLVVFNNEIHLAREVTKANATQLHAFRSPLFGPVGLIYGRSVRFVRPCGGLRDAIPAKRISAQVELVKFCLGMSTLLLDAVRDSPADGVVVEGAGVGHVSVEVARAVGSIVESGKPVVLTSRCYESLVTEDVYAFVGSEKYLREGGAIPAPGLNGPKARIKLMLALSLTREIGRIREMFAGPVAYRD